MEIKTATQITLTQDELFMISNALAYVLDREGKHNCFTERERDTAVNLLNYIDGKRIGL